MTTKKELMLEALNEKEDFFKKDFEMEQRIWDAQTNIDKLQQELEEKKSQRPKFLADKKDISQLNKRMKKIEEEIEIYKDTITGVTEKREKFNQNKMAIINNAQVAYREYIKELLIEIKNEYIKIAPIMAQVLIDYLTIENLARFGRDYYSAVFKYDTIGMLPNPDNEKQPFFRWDFYKIMIANRTTIMGKYNIPDFGEY